MLSCAAGTSSGIQKLNQLSTTQDFHRIPGASGIRLEQMLALINYYMTYFR